MKKILITLLVALSLTGLAQDKITTFILVRHAEKDMTQSTNDPDLSAAGKERATRLAEVLKKTDVTAIYSTPFKRTRQTVEPLASNKGLAVQSYTANTDKDIDAMLAQHAGGTLVIAGHSNTIPQFANYLLNEKKFSTFEDSDYGNLLVVTVLEKGKTVKVAWLSY